MMMGKAQKPARSVLSEQKGEKMKKETEIKEVELRVTRYDAEDIMSRLNTVPCSEEECMGEKETITHTANFGQGIEMDIKVCGVSFMEGIPNMPWTEAVLFENGCQVACSEPGEDFFGEWELSYGDTVYRVIVTADE